MSDWIEALGHSEVFVCITDSAGRRTHTAGPLAGWLADDPDLLKRDGPFVHGGRAWVKTTQNRSTGEAVHVVKPATTAALTSSEQARILQPLVESSPVAILTLDLQMRVTMWNPACERIFGWSQEEVLGKPYPLVPADEWERFEGFFQTVISGQGFNGVEAERQTSDGSRVYIAISTAPVRDDQGDVIGAMAILEDITQRKILEEQNRQATKLEAIGRLAGGIAHDFNNLLTVILGYSDGLAEVDSASELQEAADAIHLAAERAAALTQQLLAFSRRQVLHVQIVDLNEVVQTTNNMVSRLIGTDITVTVALAEQPIWVHVDPIQMEQVLINLATNARDAMPSGGELRITTSRVEHSGQTWAQLSVSDTGEGIDAETAAHIFDPFFTTKETGKGTGLGLASVYGVAHQSGGDVTVESEPGEGATFRVQLPMSEAPQVEAAVEDEREQLEQDASILLAEDNGDVRRILGRMLSAAGHTVRAAENGTEALAIARRHISEIDVLITDVVMPGMTGGELAQKMKLMKPELKVLFVSGYADDEAVKRGAIDGAPLLHKPFTLEGVRAAVAQLLDTD
ncbi:MAG: ATP-binding protein [Planctomycetota bacterium]|nr:ATP-binding protein [Planctomycetota bacterium]MEC8651800.1 ATP-binding protein [Planctomycetota bacterium]